MNAANSSPRRLLLTALAAWVVVALTASSVQHAHAGASQPHPHDFGWVAIAGHQALGANGEWHRHRILFGVEMPAEPCEPNVSLESVVISDAEAPASFELLPMPALHAAASNLALNLGVNSPSLAVSASESYSICHFARRNLSGVLLI